MLPVPPHGLSRRTLLLVILRGGLDGLSAVVPMSDPALSRQRPELVSSLQAEGALTKLDGTFSLAPALLGPALEEGIRARAMVDGAGATREQGARAVSAAADGAARLLARPDGSRVATMELSGWDTHANQQAALSRRLDALAKGLLRLADGLGSAWSDTVVVVVSEFGRTVAGNGTAGTDHGTGGLALVLGGAVAGGRVLGQWPGLSRTELFEERDLRPTTDTRDVLAAVLREHMGVAERDIAAAFPGLHPALEGVVRG